MALMVAVSLLSMVATFLVATGENRVFPRSYGFAAIVGCYLAVAAVMVHWNTRGLRSAESGVDETQQGSIVDGQLHAIEEAAQYFGGKLSPADMFRLVSSQINHVLPFDGCVLMLVDPEHAAMRVELSLGQNAEKFRNSDPLKSAGLAERSFTLGEAQYERGLLESRAAFPAEALVGFRSSAAVPLKRNCTAFGVLQLFSKSPTAFNADALVKLEAAAERAAPMIASSLSYERSLASALTDPVTELPNERAFRLILENQIAESQRNRGDRPLTMIAIDIRDFDEINSRFGHSTGDRLLRLISQVIRRQLRQMDFVARSSNDEFLAIFPTADETVASEIVDRINVALVVSRFFVSDSDSIVPELYFGTAAFGKHGETADQMIHSARLNKQQAKAKSPANVVWFPERAVG